LIHQICQGQSEQSTEDEDKVAKTIFYISIHYTKWRNNRHIVVPREIRKMIENIVVPREIRKMIANKATQKYFDP
jgi:hypothetical protein